MTNFLHVFCKRISELSGSAFASIGAFFLIVVWLVTGPYFHFSDTWQLVINTLTSVVTFLIVFIIQHTQNRDTISIQLKLDELIRANQQAHNFMMDLEKFNDKQIEQLETKYKQLSLEEEPAFE